MKKLKIHPCPFCGKTPSGKRFCSTDLGPSLICDHCLAEGPPPIKPPEEFVGAGAEERKLHPKAIAAWNVRAGYVG